uniref:Uncharacterized protein n=1 Tax=Cucumis melo TaxID=3656 RepID=A0A9I9EBJ4_CUCME
CFVIGLDGLKEIKLNLGEGSKFPELPSIVPNSHSTETASSPSTLSLCVLFRSEISRQFYIFTSSLMAICKAARNITKPIIAEKIPKFKIDSVEFEALTLGSLSPTFQEMFDMKESYVEFEILEKKDGRHERGWRRGMG